ncbi:sigma-70 family RNA polymerase sigma factor [Nocardia veterana]|uniref:Sigma-70 family RNA polymerase sigma factor n=1 Tax=Nocardia veterana TaxID=132249 RepID=A0A7X6M1S1_9NOCA|nr:sigma-70 family RNA polymerase sigma factor [Nocardia veterana]
MTKLLGVILADCARDPLSLLAVQSGGSALIRIGRGANAPARPDFGELLLEAVNGAGDALLAWATRQVGNRADAEDIVQTALMRVYAASPDIDDAEELRAYLWTTAKNLVRDAWRRSSNDHSEIRADSDERMFQLADRAGLPLDDIVALRHTLIAALNALPAREREAVVLRAYEGNTYAETARIMGVTTGTAKGYVHDGLRRVRAQLDAAA